MTTIATTRTRRALRRLTLLSLSLIVAAGAMIGASGHAAAAANTWSGAVSGNWNTAGNWSGGVPTAGQALVFPPAATTTAMTDDIPGTLSVASLTFNAAPYSVGFGGSVTVTGDIHDTAASGGTVFIAFSTLNLPNASNLIADAAGSTLFIDSNVTAGASPITVKGPGPVELQGGSTYPGGLVIDGTSAADATALTNLPCCSAGSGNITVQSGGSLGFVDNSGGPGSTFAGNLTVSGTGNGTHAALYAFSGVNRHVHLSGTVTLAANTTISHGAADLQFQGVVSGGFTLSSANTTAPAALQFSNAGNTFGGLTVTNELVLGDAGGTFGTGPITATTSDFGVGGGTWGNAWAINNITLTSTATATLSGAAVITGNLQASSSAGVLTLSGPITGTGGITVPTGTVVLSGGNGYTGATTVSSSATLRVDGAQPGSTVAVNNATLKGVGTTGAVTTTAGTVAPGDSPGILTTAGLALDAGSTFVAPINGTTAGTQYSQLFSSGPVALNNATLNLTLGYIPVGGDTWTLIRNNSGSAVTGTFGGLAEGATFTVSGRALTITYRGGVSAADVVVRASIPVPNAGAAAPLVSPGWGMILLGILVCVASCRPRRRASLTA